MALPLSYNLRNLVERKTTTAMTALGIALSAAVLMTVLALMSGLHAALSATGDPRNVIVMRKGSNAEMTSSLSRQEFQDLLFTSGIAMDESGKHPLASLEIVTVVNLGGEGLKGGSNINLRGLVSDEIPLHDVRLINGRWFSSGEREVVVGSSVVKRHPEVGIGSSVHIGPNDWKVVGTMDGGQSAANSEIFADLNQVASVFNRQDELTSVLLRATNEAAVPGLISALEQDRRLNVTAQSERTYYSSQTVSGAPIQFLGTLISVIMALGSTFAAMNTMYASVARRSAEVGTLRTLGFSQTAILGSFLLESILLASIAGIAACAVVFPLNFVTTAIGNLKTFTETAFRFQVGLKVMAGGMLFAIVIGAVGGLLPARMAARKEILAALKGA
jgi:putative ABC transport system permease protein